MGNQWAKFKSDNDNDKPPRGNRQQRRCQLQSEVRKLREQQLLSPRRGVQREVREGVKSESDPSPTWMDRLRRRNIAKKQPIKRLARPQPKRHK